MANTSIQKLYAHASKAREALRKTRAREREASSQFLVRAGCGASTIVGLLAAGAIDGKWGYDGKAGYESAGAEKNGIACIGPVPINAGLGLVAIAAGIPGKLPGSEYLVSLGASLLAYPLAKTVEARMQEGAAE